jgi:hypothetical protein
MRKIVKNYILNVLLSTSIPVGVFSRGENLNYSLSYILPIFLLLLAINVTNFLLLIKGSLKLKVFLAFVGTIIPATILLLFQLTKNGYTSDYIVPFVASIINFALNISLFFQHVDSLRAETHDENNSH